MSLNRSRSYSTMSSYSCKCIDVNNIIVLSAQQTKFLNIVRYNNIILGTMFKHCVKIFRNGAA